MKQGLTELVFILDRSGSMAGLETDTIGGFNAMLKKQQEVPDEAVVTTVLFDNSYELLHDRISIGGIRPITEKEYYVGGSTALLDAIGKTIHKIANAQKHTAEALRAEKVLFVITTDGMENASREYTYGKVKELVELEQSQYGWEFVFLGANIDAISTAASMGIGADRAANYHADSRGTEVNYAAVSNLVSAVRASAPVGAEWKASIERDFKQRKK